jgi:hypothetical protein
MREASLTSATMSRVPLSSAGLALSLGLCPEPQTGTRPAVSEKKTSSRPRPDPKAAAHTGMSRQEDRKVVRSLVWLALGGLLAFDVLGLGRNFARTHRFVSGWKVVRRPTSADAVDRVCQAVNYACVWYPRRVQCLQRSAVTTCLLRSRGVSAKMAIGVQQLPFKAHAWTEVDGQAINERRDVRRIYDVLESC